MTGWKTFVFNAALILFPLLDFIASPHFGKILPEEYQWILPIIGAIGLFLRTITKTPIFKSDT